MLVLLRFCDSQCLQYTSLVPHHTNFDMFRTSKQHTNSVCVFVVLIFVVVVAIHANALHLDCSTQEVYYDASLFDSICWNYTLLAPLYMVASLSLSFMPPLNCSLFLHVWVSQVLAPLHAATRPLSFALALKTHTQKEKQQNVHS